MQPSSRQRDDIPLKILVVNCRSVVDKKPQMENLIDSTQADIILGTESWLNDQHLSTAVFPKGFKVFRKDRCGQTGGGVFILVSERLVCLRNLSLMGIVNSCGPRCKCQVPANCL